MFGYNSLECSPSVGGDLGVDNERYEQGLDAYASQFQIPREEVASWFVGRVGERFGDQMIFSAAGIWVDDELSLRDRSFIVIAALITQGGAEQQLRSHTRWAVRHGCTRQQLEALATLLSVSVGGPRASNGWMVMREELVKLGTDSETTSSLTTNTLEEKR